MCALHSLQRLRGSSFATWSHELRRLHTSLLSGDRTRPGNRRQPRRTLGKGPPAQRRGCHSPPAPGTRAFLGKPLRPAKRPLPGEAPPWPGGHRVQAQTEASAHWAPPPPAGPGGAALWSGARGRGLASCPQVCSLQSGQHLLTEWGPELAQGWGSAVLATGLWGPTREGSAGRVSTQHPCPLRPVFAA